jgi:hypothetical protein
MIRRVRRTTSQKSGPASDKVAPRRRPTRFVDYVSTFMDEAAVGAVRVLADIAVGILAGTALPGLGR